MFRVVGGLPATENHFREQSIAVMGTNADGTHRAQSEGADSRARYKYVLGNRFSKNDQAHRSVT